MQAKQAKGEDFDIIEFQRLRQILEQQVTVSDQRRQQQILQIAKERREKLLELRRQGELAIASIQNRYKLAALFLPPIPPLLIGIVVFAWRRLQEREGISKTRRR